MKAPNTNIGMILLASLILLSDVATSAELVSSYRGYPYYSGNIEMKDNRVISPSVGIQFGLSPSDNKFRVTLLEHEGKKSAVPVDMIKSLSLDKFFYKPMQIGNYGQTEKKPWLEQGTLELVDGRKFLVSSNISLMFYAGNVFYLDKDIITGDNMMRSVRLKDVQKITFR